MTPIAVGKPVSFVLPSLRFFRTPKGILIAIFAALALLAIVSAQDARMAHNLVLATGVAAALDVGILLARRGAWTFPDGAMLTGMIVAFILRPQESRLDAHPRCSRRRSSPSTFSARAGPTCFNPAAVGLVCRRRRCSDPARAGGARCRTLASSGRRPGRHGGLHRRSHQQAADGDSPSSASTSRLFTVAALLRLTPARRRDLSHRRTCRRRCSLRSSCWTTRRPARSVTRTRSSSAYRRDAGVLRCS